MELREIVEVSLAVEEGSQKDREVDGRDLLEVVEVHLVQLPVLLAIFGRGKVALEDHVTDTPEETDVLEVGETELGKAPLLERWATKDTSDRNRSDDSARVFESVLKHNR